MALTLVAPVVLQGEKGRMTRGASPEVAAGTPAPRMRRAERRAGLPRLLASVAEGVTRAQSPRELRARLEQALCRVLRAERVAITETVCAPVAAPANVVSVAIPAPRPFRARVEAGIDGRGPYDAWDRQLLRAAGCVASLVLALERQARSDAALEAAAEARAHNSTLLLGSSDALRTVRERVARVAATDFTILIEGESGTGKELVARQIHARSRRRRGPFVAINCAALVETLVEAELFGIEERTATGVRGRQGKFEHADRGTLFLDEVSDLSLSAQAKLLRAIQDMSVERVGGAMSRRVDTRIIVATNRSLVEMVDRGRFRLDLYYRLSGVEITVPPLRSRVEDIQELAMAFLERHRHVRRMTFSATAMEALRAYHWPGNVRELERMIERAVALTKGDRIDLDDLPPGLAGDYAAVLIPAAARNETMRAWQRRYVRLVLERHGGNKQRACRALGISSHTLRAHLKAHPAGCEVGRTRAAGGHGE